MVAALERSGRVLRQELSFLAGLGEGRIPDPTPAATWWDEGPRDSIVARARTGEETSKIEEALQRRVKPLKT